MESSEPGKEFEEDIQAVISHLQSVLFHHQRAAATTGTERASHIGGRVEHLSHARRFLNQADPTVSAGTSPAVPQEG
jgi:hypothetical protein